MKIVQCFDLDVTLIAVYMAVVPGSVGRWRHWACRQVSAELDAIETDDLGQGS